MMTSQLPTPKAINSHGLSSMTYGFIALAVWIALCLLDHARNSKHNVHNEYEKNVDITLFIPEQNQRLSSDYQIDEISDGVNGAYLVKRDETKLGIFKPIDEEAYAPNNRKGKVGAFGKESPLRPGITVGDAAIKEISAYLLDHGHIAQVPETEIVSLSTPSDSKEKIGSIQRYVPHIGCSEDFSSSKFSSMNIQKIAQLDMRIFNCDRHSGNLLVQGTGDQLNLVPIDHGYSLPHFLKLQDAFFEWSNWDQAKLPFSDTMKEYIEKISIEDDAVLLKQAGLSDSSIMTYILCTIFLKVASNKGKSIKWIAEFMQRDLIAFETSSGLENIIRTSMGAVDGFSTLDFNQLDWRHPLVCNFLREFVTAAVKVCS